MTRDIQEKMKTVGVPQHYQSSFVQDVMGTFYSPDTKGLVDAESNEEFDQRLLNLCSVWQKREAEFSKTEAQMYQWFSTYHAEDVHNSMIVPVQEKAGLGSPPAHYTTNGNESFNNVIKQAIQYKEKNWDQFCDEMLALVKIRWKKLLHVLVNINFEITLLFKKSLHLCGLACL